MLDISYCYTGEHGPLNTEFHCTSHNTVSINHIIHGSSSMYNMGYTAE